MSDLVDPTQIETIVGAPRHPTQHIARMVEGTVYILHSQRCKDSGIDLRECPWSRSMDAGVIASEWGDRPHFVAPMSKALLPLNRTKANATLDVWIQGGERDE